MIKVFKYPKREDWQALLKRPASDTSSIRGKVEEILRTVKTEGDYAIKNYALQFDGVSLSSFEVSKSEWEKGAASVNSELKKAIDVAIKNISTFHAAQKDKSLEVETSPGVVCRRKSVAIEKVGLYIPGGTAPLFSTLLMLGVPAVMAGCREVIVCTPSDKEGNVNPAILYAALKTGIHRLFRIGGVQAIAAMAYGSNSVPQVYKIFGPGNQYVTCAKMLLNAEGIAIDMPAGPSEVAVLADETCIPEFVAADLLSQAEHGVDSQVIVVSDSEEVLERINKCVGDQLAALPRKDIAQKALLNSKAILVKTLDEGMALLNEYAPEHLIISCKEDEALADRVINAGSVFIGNYSPESAGDYASGTNHTLPTNGFAKAYSGVSLDSFVKKITFQKLSKDGLKGIGPAIEQMAMAEGLKAHSNAVTIRIKSKRGN